MEPRIFIDNSNKNKLDDYSITINYAYLTNTNFHNETSSKLSESFQLNTIEHVHPINFSNCTLRQFFVSYEK